MEKRRIAILGSTGSIGRQALDVVRQHRDLFDVELITANNSTSLLIEQAIEFNVNNVVICNEKHYGEVASALSPYPIKVFAGMKSVCDLVGSDNIDIVVNELDALANIDFATRQMKDTFRQLNIVRIGTSGGLQPDLPVGSFVIAEVGIGFDGVLNFYAGRNDVCDLDFERHFCQAVGWNPLWAKPYVAPADAELVARIGRDDMKRGCTISANGFYGPQGRQLRLPLADPELNHKIEAFSYNGRRITNYEMESAALQGLCRMMGHRAMTVCAIIANRTTCDATSNYKTAVRDLIATVLDRL